MIIKVYNFCSPNGIVKEEQEEENEIEIVKEATSLTATPPNARCRAFRDMFFLATAYGANLGGTGSITGTGTNLVLKGMLRRYAHTSHTTNVIREMRCPGLL